MFLFCGLGNKGAGYKYTRHNLGYLVIDRYAEHFGIDVNKKASKCIVGETNDLILAKPDTYMNLSGGPLASLVRKRNIPLDNLVLIHDDLDMDFGRIKIRWNGSDGGHKGVRSIIDFLGSPLFHRLKIGIGRDPVLSPEEYVLVRFRKDELEPIAEILDTAVDALHTLVTESPAKAMSLYNRG
ncbi:MAG TPA: aminoacyl-tRNA hydrolase [Syntrophorhabdales bacterium]|nr:aminoacyl-tRNA hydrolase [Syntrophorhabdales bacterium]